MYPEVESIFTCMFFKFVSMLLEVSITKLFLPVCNSLLFQIVCMKLEWNKS